MQFEQATPACSSVSGRNLIVTCSPTSIFKEWGENERAFLSWTGRDKLSWSHRDAAHISRGHLLRYSCSRTCDVHKLYQTREDSCKEVLRYVISNVVSPERHELAHW